MDHPAPVRSVLKKKKTGNIESPGEMGGEGVDGDHEVELRDDCGERHQATVGEQRGIAEAGVVETAPLVTDGAALQVPILAIFSRENGCEELKRDRAGGIPVTGGPDDADVGDCTRGVAGAYGAGSASKLRRRKLEMVRGGG
jgi:hypothetical protein